jgi:hypothetical protein
MMDVRSIAIQMCNYCLGWDIHAISKTDTKLALKVMQPHSLCHNNSKSHLSPVDIFQFALLVG